MTRKTCNRSGAVNGKYSNNCISEKKLKRLAATQYYSSNVGKRIVEKENLIAVT